MKRYFLLFLLLFAMWATNPTLDNFADYAVEKYREANPETNSGLLGFFTDSFGAEAIKLMTTADDYKIFTIFTVHNGTEKVKIIGAFKKVFFRL
ncbi:hypothetical protein E5161_16920 [Cohnella pontilimi]|uniref:DUF4359 domain-containing protein n=1 Tax=Cohnella pontilimi TaxID=2564100 RepID=A0A4U0F876_9BACL|nr:hypothetical protein [Cohnella pontilimi]TJY40821.1 hypothetical protein E5161_16920 [Cohnella pontilimi]